MLNKIDKEIVCLTQKREIKVSQNANFSQNAEIKVSRNMRTYINLSRKFHVFDNKRLRVVPLSL